MNGSGPSLGVDRGGEDKPWGGDPSVGISWRGALLVLQGPEVGNHPWLKPHPPAGPWEAAWCGCAERRGDMGAGGPEVTLLHRALQE